ncbi:MAG: hypothetical protein P9F19_15945 [Candidatus Contendobacter sp.]|nr:hypothetical protein [Candidatus Contendobacter sp.]MDG4558864.1 hypothetical protein [Candidatus Contendobacter sp.]
MKDDDDELASMRRRMDRVQEQRMIEISAAISKLQESFEKTLREATVIQAAQTTLMERQNAFNQAFLEHDEREGEDRQRIIETMDKINTVLSHHNQEIKIHAESIGTLKQWTWYLAATVGALASSGVAWIIQHLQNR